MEYAVLVDVRPRDGIADPAGTTVERSLFGLGFRGISGVTVGKTVRFRVEAVDQEEARAVAENLCATFLTNPVIEDAVISVELPEEV
jgi:phosphoribosylformylglycinamidine synthase